MNRQDYVEPTIEWLVEQFHALPLGAARPSEMEIILAYTLMYHNNDLDKSEYDLAEIYRLTETKALRLKQEFGKRYLNTEAGGFAAAVARIGKRLFEDKSIDFEWDEIKARVSFTLTDPCELRALKRALDFNNLPWHGSINGKLVTLSLDKFIALFLKYYPGLYEQLKPCLSTHLKTRSAHRRVFDASLPLDHHAKKLIAALAPEALPTLLTIAGVQQ